MDNTGMFLLAAAFFVLIAAGWLAVVLAVAKIPWLLRGLVDLVFPQMRERKAERREAAKKATEIAIQACKKHFPDEPIIGAGVRDEEPGRYVVIVFYGNRVWSSENYRAPPWRDYLVVTVWKNTDTDEVIADDQERYRPVVR
jgi:hypothetical protein